MYLSIIRVHQKWNLAAMFCLNLINLMNQKWLYRRVCIFLYCAFIIMLKTENRKDVNDDIDATGELNQSVECRIYFLKLSHSNKLTAQMLERDLVY